MEKKRFLAYGLLLLTAALWGFAAPVVKYTLSFVNPVGFLFWRFLLVSLLFLIPFLIVIKKKPISGRHLLKLSLIGILGGPITLLLIFWGADKTTSINASLIVATAPIFIVFAGSWFLKEEVTKRERFGLSVALAGTIVTVLQPLLGGGLTARNHLWGNALIFAHNFVWAAYCILIKKESQKHSPLVLTALTFFSGLLILPPLYFWQRANLSTPTPLFYLNPQAIPGILYMSVFSSVIAYTTYNWGVSLIEASEATVFTYLQPVFAAPLSYFWLGEKMTLPFFLGAGLITLGVFLAEYKDKSK
jgi:drug/metabolite transporter (DMT)-like permease